MVGENKAAFRWKIALFLKKNFFLSAEHINKKKNLKKTKKKKTNKDAFEFLLQIVRSRLFVFDDVRRIVKIE